MNYQVGSVCYPTAEAAAAASASSVVGSIVNHGGSAYVVNVDGVTSEFVYYSFTPVIGGVTTYMEFAYTPQPCGMLGADDAITMGWMVGAAWLGAYALMFLGRVVRDMVNERGSQDGNA